MGIDAAVIERTRFFVGPEGVVTLDGRHNEGTPTRGRPTHFGGLSINAVNLGSVATVLSLSDSEDGSTFFPLSFSDTLTSGLLAKTLVGLGEQAILVETCRRYLRVTCAPAAVAGVMLDLMQHPPRGATCTFGYYSLASGLGQY